MFEFIYPNFCLQNLKITALLNKYLEQLIFFEPENAIFRWDIYK